jgi:hypothetical protein
MKSNTMATTPAIIEYQGNFPYPSTTSSALVRINTM